MKIDNHPDITASPEELAKAQRSLIAAFSILFFFNVFIFLLSVWIQPSYPEIYSQIEPFLPLIEVCALLASIFLIVALYRAARVLGYNTATIVAALVLTFFVSILGLVLVLSAHFRISKHLKKQGWKIGLLGAEPPQRQWAG